MRYSRQTEIPDCKTAEQAKDAILALRAVKVMQISFGAYRVEADGGIVGDYTHWNEAIDRAKYVKGIEREAGTNKVCYVRPLLIVTVPDMSEDRLKKYTKRPKLRTIRW